jgi:beta-lactam-binding protein with PASTA domain
MPRRFLTSLFQIGSLLLLLVVVGLLAAITTMHFAIHGAEVQIPALKGMTVAEARSQTAGLGLNLDVDNRYYSAEVAAGHILTQSPPPGTIVRREWRVRVAESLGPQRVEVPNAVGSQARAAALLLRRAGLEMGVISELPWSEGSGSGAPEGTVLAQDPPARAQGIAQPSVNLLVAAPGGDTPDGFVMPDLSGVPIVSAQAELEKVGIKTAPPTFVDVPIGNIGASSTPPRPPAQPGSVTVQDPPAGARVDQSTLVKLTVAK